MTPMTQEEIITGTKTVVQGLDTLRLEHHQILNSLLASTKNIKTESSSVSTGLVDEKVTILRRSMDAIELAIGEAQVGFTYHHHYYCPINKWASHSHLGNFRLDSLTWKSYLAKSSIFLII